VINVWERILHPDTLSYLASLLEEQRETTKKVSELTQQLKEVTDEIRALVSLLASIPSSQTALQQSGVVGRPPIPLPSLPLPFSSSPLNDMLRSVYYLSPYVTPAIDALNTSFSVPPGQYSKYVITRIPDTVLVFTSPLYYSSTYYSYGLLDVNIDGNVYASAILTDSGKLESVKYAISRHEANVYVKNDSDREMIITAKAEAIYIDRNFFDLFYAPLINYGFDVMKVLATLINGGQEI